MIINKDESRRVVCVNVSINIIKNLITQDVRIESSMVERGIPQNAKFINIFNNSTIVCLIFEHPNFDVVYPGEVIPVLNLKFKNIL